MAEVVAERNYILENSNELSRPSLKAFLEPDTNVGHTDVTSFVEKQIHQKLHVPNSTGPLNYDVNCCDNKLLQNLNAKNSIKKRNDLRVMDPITSFISVSGEVLLNSTKYGMTSFGKARIEPHTTLPQNKHSIRTREEAIDEIKRLSEYEQNPVLNWNSQKISDTLIKSRLGGWTSESDPRVSNEKNNNPYKLKDIFPNADIPYKNEEERNKLAKDFIYTTSTQEMYSHVNWDSKLPRKLHAPITTYEKGVADPLKRSDQADHRPQIWQTSIGATWDRHQDRTPQFSRHPVQFTSPTKRGNHLPGYSGHIGGKNIEAMNDVIEDFEPFTILRTQQPKEPEPNYKPNIPGYTGKTHPYKTINVSHYDKTGRPYTTTAAYHRILPHVDQIHPEPTDFYGDFSKIQTKVPPNNPFDNIARPVYEGINNSIDNANYPIINEKPQNGSEFLIKNRERELRSILKKHPVPAK